MTDVLRRCSREAWCHAMAEALNPRATGGKGFSVTHGWDPGDPKGSPPRVFGVRFRARAHTEGLLLKFCPWCGQSLSFWKEGAEPVLAEGAPLPPTPCCGHFALTGAHWHGCPEAKR